MNKLTIAEKLRRFFDSLDGKILAEDVYSYFPDENPESLRSEITTLVNRKYVDSEKIPGSHKRLFSKSGVLDRAYKSFFMMKPTEPKNPKIWG